MPAKTKLHRAFCQNVKVRRRQMGLTQEQVADRLGITQPAYAAIESGKAAPTLTVVERVASALRISASLLLASEELVMS